MKIGLGTVQFGLDYGISNPGGKTAEEEVARIFEYAAAHDITVVDTAALYGNSEEVVGRATRGRNGFRLVTKTPFFTGETEGGKELERAFGNSLCRLQQSSLYGLLVHRVEDLFAPGGPQLYAAMAQLKDRGLVTKIGVSVYTGAQIDAVLERYPIDLIQLPINILDQRLLLSGHLRSLRKAEVEVHARSVFLQGLLLMPPESLSPYFEPIRGLLAHYRDVLHHRGLSPLEAAVGFVASLDEIDTVVCGVNTLAQFREICEVKGTGMSDQWREFAVSDEKMVNPSLWRL